MADFQLIDYRLLLDCQGEYFEFRPNKVLIFRTLIMHGHKSGHHQSNRYNFVWSVIIIRHGVI